MKSKARFPREGDLVGVPPQIGTFFVSVVYATTVDLEKVGCRGNGMHGIPWGALTYREEEGESQNALRVVREATEE
jgi:hypothetical protein